MPRDAFVRVSVLAAGLTLSVAVDPSGPSTRPALAAEPKNETPDQEAEERKKRYADWMRTYSEETKISLVGEDDAQIKLVPKPIFRYSDEPQLIPDATLWVWTRNDRPIAFQKVEGNNFGGGQMWTICFVSLSEGLLKVSWSSGHEYASRTPGVTFKPMPGAEPPADNARARAIQMKALKDRFAARLSVDAEGKGGSESRTISKPLFEYADPESKLPVGAIYGMSATGTNPDLLLLLETRPDEGGKLRWEYAYARITANSLIMRLDDQEIWSEVGVPSSAAGYDTWTYYFLRRGFK
jgi:hypothetical protein